MPTDRPRPFALIPAALLAASLMVVGCESATSSRTKPTAAGGAGATTVSASTPAPEPRSRTARRVNPRIAEVLTESDPDVLEFMQHIVTLSDPFFEGRSADTRGNRLAAEYVDFHFTRLGLEPVFSADSALAAESRRQELTVPGDIRVDHAALAWADASGTTQLIEGADFNAMGFSDSGRASGTAVFVGYSIEEGPGGYATYHGAVDLTGKIAVMLRFEPLDDEGKSRWSGNASWSRHSGLLEKVGAAVQRGAAGVIVINPPGTTDKRADVLATANETRFGAPAGVPVATLSQEAADRFFRAADREGRDLLAFRRLADESSAIVPLRPDVEVTVDVTLERERLATDNVGGVLRGKGALADRFIVIGGHYDHVGYGYVGGARPGNIGQLHPGADDNASGTAGVILLAEKMREAYAAMPEGASARSVLFLAFTAEEMGLLGADYFVKNTPIPPERIDAMINLDMVGRVKDEEVEVFGVGTAEGFTDVIQPALDRSGLRIKKSPSGIGPSDHSVFHRAGLPVLHFFTGTHPDYHAPSDTFEKVNYEDGVRVVRLIADIAETLATRPEGLAYVRTQGERPRGPGRGNAKVRLGIMPGDYSGTEPGVLVGDVTKDTSAAIGGVRAGDRIVRWGGTDLKDIPDMMRRLGTHNPGDVVELVVIRDGAEVPLTVTLMAPDAAR